MTPEDLTIFLADLKLLLVDPLSEKWLGSLVDKSTAEPIYNFPVFKQTIP